MVSTVSEQTTTHPTPSHKPFQFSFKNAGDRVLLFLLFEVCVVILCTYNFTRSIGLYFPGFTEFYDATDSTYKRNGMPANWSTPDLSIDHIVTVNGEPYANAQQVFQAAAARGEKSVTVEIKTDGETLETAELPIQVFTAEHLLDILQVPVLISICSLILAFQIRKAQPRNPIYLQGAVLFAMFDFLAIERSSLFWLEGNLAKGLDLVTVWQACFLGAVILHFGLSFPFPIQSKHRWAIYAAYGFSTIAGLLYTTARLLYWQNNLIELPLLESIPIALYRILAAIGTLGTTGYWAWLCWQHRHNRYDVRKLVLLLIGIGPTIILLYVIVTASDFHFSYIDTRVFLLWFCWMVTFAILRYQVFEVSANLILLIPIAAGGVIFANISIALLRYSSALKDTIPSPFLILFGSYFFCSILWAYSARLIGKLEQFVYPQRYHYNILLEYNKKLAALEIDRSLPNTLIELTLTLREQFKLQKVAFWVHKPELDDHSTYYLVPIDQQYSSLKIPKNDVKESIEPIQMDQDDVTPWQQSLRAEQLILLLPLIVNQRMLGLLAFSQRQEVEFFSKQDLEIFKLLGQETALFLLVQQYIDQVNQLPQELEAVQLTERARLHNELHDLVLPFFPGIELALQLIQETLPQENSSQNIIRQSIQRTNETSRTLRAIIHDLQPDLQFEFAEQLLAEIAQRTNFHRNLLTDIALPKTMLNSLPLLVKRCIYYTLLQAVDNVCQHAQATHLVVATNINIANQSILFQIKDDGVGFEVEHANRPGHFGLKIMQARLKQIQAKQVIQSSRGQGTTVEIHVPIESSWNLI
jgi:signal transduction histidine kinase